MGQGKSSLINQFVDKKFIVDCPNTHILFGTRVVEGSSQKVKPQAWDSAIMSRRYNDKRATIYTDGACSNNGRSNGQGGIGVYWGENHQNNISEPLSGRQTNQRAEIEAARRGIEQARSEGYKSVTVKTDSQYVKNAAESWIPNWERNGYTSAGKPVVNESEFRALKDSMRGMDVNFEKVDRSVNAADPLAREGAKRG